MKHKILALAAVAALGISGSALAHGRAGQHGKAHTHTAKTQKVGFTLAGVLGSDTATFPQFTAVGDNFTASAFSLDLTSANKHARNALGIQKSAIEGTGLTAFNFGTDQFKLTVEGITNGGDTTTWNDDLAAGDRVKVIGKVERTRESHTHGKPTWDYGTVDVRKVIVTREAPQS